MQREERSFLESIAATAEGLSSVDLLEIAAAHAGKVDGNVIRGVKLLGFESQNPTLGYPTRYAREAVKKAIPLYEGAPIHVDHPPRDNPNLERRCEDRIGRAKNVRMEQDGLRGDAVLNPEHPLTKKILWEAANEPDLIGFSHNAKGAGSVVNGAYVVQELSKVNGLDLVTRPSTTRGLFESIGLMEATAGELVKAQVVQEASRRLVMDFMDLMHSIARSPLDAKTKREQLKAAMHGLMAAMEDDMGADAKKVMESVAGATQATTQATTPSAAPAQKAADLSLMESRMLAAEERATKAEARLGTMEGELAAAKKKERIAGMIRDAKLRPEAVTPVFDTALMEAKDDAAVKALIDDRAAVSKATGTVQLVESRAAGAPPSPSVSSVKVTDGRSLAQSLGVKVPAPK